MRQLVTAMLLVAAIIHLLPLPGAFGPERLAALYGLSFDEPNLAILMRHRAILFGLFGAFLLVAADLVALAALVVALGALLYLRRGG